MKKRKQSVTESVLPEIPWAEVPTGLSRLSELLASLSSLSGQAEDRLIELFRPHHLLLRLNSPCYGLPYPFLVLNARVVVVPKSNRLHWEHDSVRSELYGEEDDEARVSLPRVRLLGFSLDQEIKNGCIHFCERWILPSPLVPCCFPEEIPVAQFASKFEVFGDPKDELRSLPQNLHRSLELLETIFETQKSEAWP